MQSCSGSRKFYGSIWRYSYDKNGKVAERFDPQLVQEKRCGRADPDVELHDGAEYPGIRVTMTTLFDGVRTPLKIDISTGDAITPKEVRYSFKLMLEDRSMMCGPTIWKPCWRRSWRPLSLEA